MARILYGVCGIGMGHCTRSLEILEELTREHEIIVVSYGSAYRMLKGMFPKTRKVKYFEMLFNETRVSKRKTLLHNLPRLPEILISNLSEYSKMLRDFRPDIVVSDFEIGSFYLSKMLMVPSIV
ncbi:MAG: glycosyltransferase family protein, partial [Candidatus Diapherotrites archaeon]